jgi:branched-chain amino acid aminotransferase
VIKIIEENGGEVIQENIDRDDLYVAEEVFMTGTAAEVKSVTKIDHATIGTGKIGRVTKELQKAFTDVTMGRDDRFLSWLKYI